MNNLEIRKTKQDAHCKVCDKLIKKDTEFVVYFKTWRGHGDATHICFDCLKVINELVNKI